MCLKGKVYTRTNSPAIFNFLEEKKGLFYMEREIESKSRERVIYIWEKKLVVFGLLLMFKL